MKLDPSKIDPRTYIKAIMGVLAALATWGITAGADGQYTQEELWGALGVVSAAVAIYVSPKNAE